MRVLLQVGAIIGATLLSSGCHGSQGGGNPLKSIDVTRGPAYLDDYGIEGAMYKFAFDTTGAPFTVTTGTVLDGLGIPTTGSTSWMSVSNPIDSLVEVGSGDTATTAMTVTLKPGTEVNTLIIANFRDATNGDCVDYDEDGVEDEGEFWRSDACWYRATNYLSSEWMVPDVSDEYGIEGAQFSAIVEWNVGVTPGETSI